MSLMGAASGVQAGQAQMQVAASIMKSNADAQKFAVVHPARRGAGPIPVRLPMWRQASAAISTSRRRNRRGALTRDRRLDERDRVVAGPFGRPGNRRDLATGSTSTVVGIPSARPTRLQILEHLGFRVGEIAEPMQPGLLQQGFRLVGVAGVDVDRHHLELGAAELGLQGVQRRHLLAAGHAPGRPQIHQHRPPAPVASDLSAARGVLEGQIGKLAAPWPMRQRGDFALDQRRHLARQIHRGRQAGSAPALRCRCADPVYPRQSDRHADHDRASTIDAAGASWARSGLAVSSVMRTVRALRESRRSRRARHISAQESVGRRHEQQDVGRPVCERPRRDHGGDQRLDRFRSASVRARISPHPRPMPRCWPTRHHRGERCEKDRARV